MEKPIEKLTESQKEVMLNGLQNLIYDLNKSGIITIQRMCHTCSFYETDQQNAHYCNLLNTELTISDIRIDCPEHEMRN